jgi:spore coat protein CotH
VTFPQDAVNTIEISMTTTQWASIRENMKALYGYDFGGRAGAGGGFPDDDPDYVALTVKYNGKQWKKMGFRLKGNSTLASAWGTGNYKLPFRLKTSEFEDTYPAIKGQRFYGFKELSFSPGRSDPSLIREKSTADILRLAGVPAARTAFYRVFIDFGQGLKYCGVYTAVEVIDDTMIKDQYGEDKGNIYKPESALRTFVEAEFEKKNNKSPADFSDVQNLITALNSPLRTTNAPQWRANLQAVFNVDHFLKWLAVNNAIVNWDVYGAIAHNYYLYNHSTKKITWIPWDHNEAMTGSPGITGIVGGGGQGAGPNRGLSLTMNEVGTAWPLVRYLADDSVYFAAYKSHLKTFANTVLVPANLNAMFDRYTALISPYVVGANGEQPGYTYTSASQFASALPGLKTHIQARRDLIAQFVP